MHNVIDIILNKVMNFYIPEMILESTFRNERGILSMKELLKDKIIVGIVLQDCNLYAGKITKIVLKPEYAKDLVPENTIYHSTGYYSMYEIPPEAREYKDIVSVIDIIRPIDYDTPSPECSNGISSFNTLGSLTNDVLNSVSGTVTVDPTPILLANNIIRIEPPFIAHMDWVLSCLLSYDENFSNITPNMVTPLTNLVVLATKAYIYNKLINDTQLAVIVGGAEFDSFRSIVESYETAHEEYKEALMKFRGAATFDKDILTSMIGMML
jgi:hypothetical protein